MLSLLKKGGNKGDGAGSSAWHPNFRNFTELPDTKVVRTSFFVNGVTGLLAAAVVTFFAYQEYNLSILNNQIAEWDSKIETARPQSQQAVALYKKFQEEQAKTTEVEQFLTGEKLQLTEFLARLGATLPQDVLITFVDYTGTGVTLRGIVSGEPELASGMASTFEKQLKDDEVIGKLFANIALTTISRDSQSGRLSFEIALRFAEEAKKK